jgi:hypothetical protein
MESDILLPAARQLPEAEHRPTLVQKDFEIPSGRRVRRLRRPGMTQRAPRNRGMDPLGLDRIFDRSRASQATHPPTAGRCNHLDLRRW